MRRFRRFCGAGGIVDGADGRKVEGEAGGFTCGRTRGRRLFKKSSARSAPVLTRSSYKFISILRCILSDGWIRACKPSLSP